MLNGSATLEPLVPLTEAARELHVSEKVLRRWIADAHLDLVKDPVDRRRQALTRGQLGQLQERYGRKPVQPGRGDTDWQEARMDNMDKRITALETSIAALSSLVTKLVETVMTAAQTSELDERTAALAAEIQELRSAIISGRPSVPAAATTQHYGKATTAPTAAKITRQSRVRKAATAPASKPTAGQESPQS